jgi:outer membrane protein assembly factor BamE (lipoprotein component of BamABCDE complex)
MRRDYSTNNRIAKKEQTMRLILLTIALIPLLLWGCATPTSITGSDFNSSLIPRIEKGVTKTSQILSWLGEPSHKEPVSATEIMWLYSWARPTANAAVVPFGHRAIGTTGYKKTLLLIIKDDIVVDYSYAEGII